MKRYTISDIAKLANVSPATVSRVLTERPGVNKSKREEVLEIIRKTNYHPSAVARSLVNRQSNVVGFVVRDIENPYYSKLAAVVQHIMQKEGFLTIILNVGNDGGFSFNQERQARLSEISKNFDFAGMLVSVPTSEDLAIDDIKACGCPIVLMNRVFDIACDQVSQNDLQVGMLATEHLIGLGHKRIQIMTGLLASSPTFRFRVEGFLQAMTAAGLEVTDEDIIETRLTIEDVSESAEHILMKHQNMPTAVVAAANVIATGFMTACDRKGVVIPEQISLVSVDNTSFLQLPRINLTTVSAPLEQIASEAASMLLDRIHTKRQKNRFVSLQAELIVRGSTTSPKNCG